MKNLETENQVINAIRKSTDLLLKDTPVHINEEAGGISKQSIGVIDNGTIKILSPAEAYFASDAHQIDKPKPKPIYLPEDQEASNFYAYSAQYATPTLQLGEANNGDHTIIRFLNDGSTALEQYGYYEGTEDDEKVSQAQEIFSELGLLAISAGQIEHLDNFIEHLADNNTAEISPGESRKLRSELADPGLNNPIADSQYQCAASPQAIAKFSQQLTNILSSKGIVHAEQKAVIHHENIKIALWRKLYVARAACLGRFIILPTKPQLTVDYELGLQPKVSDVYDSITRCTTINSDQTSVYFEVYETEAEKLKARVKELEEDWHNTRDWLDPRGTSPKQYIAQVHAQAGLQARQQHGESDSLSLNLPGLRQTLGVLEDAIANGH